MVRSMSKLGWSVWVAISGLLSLGCGSSDSTSSASTHCVPNGDNVLSALELNAVPGASGSFLRATGVSVDTAGTLSNGKRTWDFQGPYPAEEAIVSTLEPMAGKWFASDFPDASYAWWLEGSELYGVYLSSAGSVTLLGYASRTDAPAGRSLAHYEPPLLMFRAPMTQGDTWKTSAKLSGSSFLGPIDQDDEYTATVDAGGTMLSPAGSLAVLRVNGLATRTDAGVTEAHRQQYYLAECRGIVGAVVSETLLGSEPAPDFSLADEIARLEN